MSDKERNMRLIDADKLFRDIPLKVCVPCPFGEEKECKDCVVEKVMKMVDDAPTVEPASPWHRVEDGLPKEPGEYIVAYHPCYWDDVKTKVTKVGIDNFRGKSAWAKKKFQRVTHWMEKPEPPKEDA